MYLYHHNKLPFDNICVFAISKQIDRMLADFPVAGTNIDDIIIVSSL